MPARGWASIMMGASATCLVALAAPAQADSKPQFVSLPGQVRPPLPDIQQLLCPVFAFEDILASVLGTPRVVPSQGHVDPIDVAYEDALEINYHDETVEPGVERDPATVHSVVSPEAKVTVPDDPAFAFLGAPGATVWVLPQVRDGRLLFPGIGTEAIPGGVFTDDSVTVRFTRVCGPDGVSLFTTGSGGEPNILVDSEDGLPDSVNLPVGTHAHQNWAFDAPGTYKIKVDASARLAATGQQVESKPVVLTFRVVR